MTIQARDANSPIHVQNILGKKPELKLGGQKIEDSLVLNKERISKKRDRQQFEQKSVTVFDTALDISVADSVKSNDGGKWDFKNEQEKPKLNQEIKKVRFNQNTNKDYNKMINISATSSLLSLMP